MKAAALKMYLQQFASNISIPERQLVEEELGFDAMLSHEVVHFLLADHSMVYPLKQKLILKANVVLMLDEHELAMV